MLIFQKSEILLDSHSIVISGADAGKILTGSELLLKKFLERCSGEKFFLPLLGGSGGMLPRKF